MNHQPRTLRFIRCAFSAYLTYTTTLTAFIYPVVGTAACAFWALGI